MEYFIETGHSLRSLGLLKTVSTNTIKNLNQRKRRPRWINHVINVIDDLADKFNFYMFYCRVFPNFPRRITLIFYNEAILDLCKLIDCRPNSKISIDKIMKDVKEKIEDGNDKNLFEKFIKDVEIWLDKKKDFIKILKTLRDKYIAHRDDDYNAMEEVSLAMRSLKNDEFIEVSNTIISIYIYLIELISNIMVSSEGYYSFNEFNFIYECLRSLDKIKYKVTEKNMIIHNIDLELQQLKRLLGIRR